MYGSTSALYSNLLDDLSGFTDDMSFSGAAASSMRKNFLKKFVNHSKEADLAAEQLFTECNNICESWNPSELDANRLFRGELRKVLYNFFSPILDEISTQKLFDLGKPGPGVSAGVQEVTDYYTKLYSSQITFTGHHLLNWYYQGVSRYTRLLEAERNRLEMFGYPVEVEAPKTAFVAKTTEISRTIRPEPVLEMIFQQGFAALLRNRLIEYFGINLEDQQEIQKKLARQGSMNGCWGTIDLKSASDLISWKFCQYVMPGDVNRWLQHLRTPLVKVGKRDPMVLHMVSTMGNAFTFPLQTIIFASIVKATYSTLGIPFRRRDSRSTGNFGVFGDDIIVCSNAYDEVVTNLHRCGFVVNLTKSFNEGHFRESCGGDYFQGQDCRSVYCSSLDTLQDVYSLVNRCNRWSAKVGIPLYRTVAYLVGLIPPGRRYWVPRDEDDDCGIHAPSSCFPHLKRRKTGLISYRVSRAKPKKLIFRSPTDSKPGRILGGQRNVERFWNEPGVLDSFLQGSIRRMTLSIRTDRVHYEEGVALTRDWDRVPVDRRYLSLSGWRR